MDDGFLFDNIPTQVMPMALYAIRDYLSTIMVSEIPESYPTRAVVVKVGRFIENPLDKNVAIAISGGDDDDPDYKDARADDTAVKNYPVTNLAVTEIGGGHYWYRRGTVQFQLYFVRQRFPEEQAMLYAYDFYGRLIRALENTPLPSAKDEYGEGIVLPVIVESSTFTESGGKDKFIWRGKIYWRLLTWRP